MFYVNLHSVVVFTTLLERIKSDNFDIFVQFYCEVVEQITFCVVYVADMYIVDI